MPAIHEHLHAPQSRKLCLSQPLTSHRINDGVEISEDRKISPQAGDKITLQHHTFGQFMRNSRRDLVHARVPQIGAISKSNVKARLSGEIGYVVRSKWNRRRYDDQIERIRKLVKRFIQGYGRDRLVLVIQAITGIQNCAAIAEQIHGNTNPGREVLITIVRGSCDRIKHLVGSRVARDK